MIIESRKWRLLVQGLVVLVCTFLIVNYSGLASYSLQDNEPIVLASPEDLATENLGGRFVTIRGLPDIAHSITLHRNGVTTFWLPLKGLEATLFVVTEDDTYERLAAVGQTLNFAGKVISFSSAPNSDQARAVYEDKTGVTVDDAAFVLMDGEQPSEFRLAVPVVLAIAVVWLLALIGFVREWRRAGQRRRARTAALPIQPHAPAE